LVHVKAKERAGESQGTHSKKGGDELKLFSECLSRWTGGTLKRVGAERKGPEKSTYAFDLFMHA